MRSESRRTYLSARNLKRTPQFVSKLRASDEVAAKVIGNTRLFYEGVAAHMALVVVVDPNQFRVIIFHDIP